MLTHLNFDTIYTLVDERSLDWLRNKDFILTKVDYRHNKYLIKFINVDEKEFRKDHWFNIDMIDTINIIINIIETLKLRKKQIEEIKI